MIFLSDITNLHDFAKEIQGKWILVSRNPRDHSMIILTYSNKTQIMCHWQENTTMIARGLVLHLSPKGIAMYDQIAESWEETEIADIKAVLEDACVVARGMPKFFTINDDRKLVDDDEGITVRESIDINPNSSVGVSDKLDGSLGIGIIMNDKMCICTKGSFDSPDALAGTEYLRTKHSSEVFSEFMKTYLHDYTPLFEIISPHESHLIQYKGVQDIVFLGLVNNGTGRWIPAALLATDPETADTPAKEIPSRFSFMIPDVYPISTLNEVFSLTDRANHEGVVLTVNEKNGRQKLFKYKYPTYLFRNYVRRNYPDKLIRSVISDQMTAADLLKRKPVSSFIEIREENREIAGKIFEEIDRVAEEKYLKAIRAEAEEGVRLFCQIAANHDLLSGEGIKEFAKEVNQLDLDKNVKRIILDLKGVVGLAALNAVKMSVKNK